MDMFAMPFEDYIQYRTQYALDVAKKSKVIDMTGGFVALLQAQWAREYWFNKAKDTNT